MKRSKRMKPISELAEIRERNAVRSLTDAQHDLSLQKNRLQELIQYRDEYTHRFEVDLSAGLDAKLVQDYRAFLMKLNAGIEQQRQLLSNTQAIFNQQRSEWVETRIRAQAIGKAIDRYQWQEEQETRRKEQKESDELTHRVKGD